MKRQKTLLCGLIGLIALGTTINKSLAQTSSKPSTPNVQNAIVFANPEKYRVHLRFGETKKADRVAKSDHHTPQKIPVWLRVFFRGSKGRLCKGKHYSSGDL